MVHLQIEICEAFKRVMKDNINIFVMLYLHLAQSCMGRLVEVTVNKECVHAREHIRNMKKFQHKWSCMLIHTGVKRNTQIILNWSIMLKGKCKDCVKI